MFAKNSIMKVVQDTYEEWESGIETEREVAGIWWNYKRYHQIGSIKIRVACREKNKGIDNTFRVVI